MRQFIILVYIIIISFNLISCSAIDEMNALNETKKLNIALTALNSRDPNSAINIYKQLIKENPEKKYLYVYLGKAFYKNKQFNKAQQIFSKIIPKNVDAYIGLGRIALTRLNIEKAIFNFKKALSIDNNNYDAYNALAVSYDILQQHLKAQKIYKNLIKKYPNRQKVKLNLSLSLALSGNPREAISIMLNIINEKNINNKIKANLAMIYMILGDELSAKKVLMSIEKPQEVTNDITFYKLILGRVH